LKSSSTTPCGRSPPPLPAFSNSKFCSHPPPVSPHTPYVLTKRHLLVLPLAGPVSTQKYRAQLLRFPRLRFLPFFFFSFPLYAPSKYFTLGNLPVTFSPVPGPRSAGCQSNVPFFLFLSLFVDFAPSPFFPFTCNPQIWFTSSFSPFVFFVFSERC